MRMANSNETSAQMQDQITSIAELQQNVILVFGRGYMAAVQINTLGNSFQVVSTQPFSESTQASEPLYFGQSCQLNDCVYVTVRERYINNQGFINVHDGIENQ